MAVTCDRQSDQIKPLTGHTLKQIRSGRLSHPVRQPALTTEKLFNHDRAEAVLIPNQGREQSPTAWPRLAFDRQPGTEFMDDFLKSPQPHRDIDEIAPIILPIFAEPPRRWGEQIDKNGINANAATQDRFNIFQQRIGFDMERQWGKAIDFFGRNLVRIAQRHQLACHRI